MEFRKTAATLFAFGGKRAAAVSKTNKPKKRAYLLTVGVFLLTLSMLSFGSFRVFADTYRTPNLSSAFGIDVSGLTTVELEDALERIKPRKFTIISGQKYDTFTLEDMGLEFDAKSTAINASQGQNNGVWSSAKGKSVLEPKLTINTQKLKDFERIMLASSRDPVDALIEIQDGVIVLIPSLPGVGITASSLVDQISSITSTGGNGITLIAQSISPAYTTADAVRDFEKAKLFSEGSVEVIAGEAVSTIKNISVMSINRPPDSTISEFGFDADKLFTAVQGIATENSDSAWNEIYEMRGDQKVILREGRNGVSFSGVQDVVDGAIESGLDGSVRKMILDSKQEIYSSYEKAEANTWIDINLTTYTMTLWENNTIQASFPISGGKEDTPTPLGDYKISGKVRKMTMSGPGYSTPNVEYVSWFKFNYAIHSAYWHDEFGRANVSKGCVNSRVEDSKYVYEWAPIGTKVSVHY